jgi:hypothetical protein
MVHSKRVKNLFHRVSDHIEQARQIIQRSIDTEMVQAYC